jgi:Peptidase family M23
MSLRGIARRQSTLLFSLFILVSCAPIQTLQPLPTITQTAFESISIATSTTTPIVPTSTIVPVAIPTVACDPLNADFCILDGRFILQRPVKPPANDSVDRSYPYGSTAHGTRDPHHGVEFENGSGTPVYAAAEGEVVFANPDEEAIYSPWKNYYGNLVVLEHEGGIFTLYAHLSKVVVQVGQKVSTGEWIAEVGRTGAAIGSHLHFEVRLSDSQDYFATQNPELWLAPKKDENGRFLGALMVSIVGQASDFQYGEFTIEYHPDRDQAQAKSYYVTTYSPDLMTGAENAALGDLPAGAYRIALNHNSQLYERWVEVESGKLTQVVLIVE